MKTVALLVMFAIFTYSCNGNNENNAVGEIAKTTKEGKMKSIKHAPFEIQLYEHNYSLAYSLQYTLNEDSLKIFKLGGLEGEKGEMIYRKSLSDEEKNKTRNFIGKFSIDSLQTHYRNPCVQDGNQKTLFIKIGDKQKQSHVSNYYQRDVGELIELLNSNIPNRFEINYDKEELQRLMKDCNL